VLLDFDARKGKIRSPLAMQPIDSRTNLGKITAAAKIMDLSCIDNFCWFDILNPISGSI
jgi:hypothetical protein